VNEDVSGQERGGLGQRASGRPHVDGQAVLGGCEGAKKTCVMIGEQAVQELEGACFVFKPGIVQF
jgi:hypothetical protein